MILIAVEKVTFVPAYSTRDVNTIMLEDSHDTSLYGNACTGITVYPTIQVYDTRPGNGMTRTIECDVVGIKRNVPDVIFRQRCILRDHECP
jgi:hypothetical protein